MFNNRYAGITLQQMYIFTIAARYENFRITAEKTHITQATVSRNIALLEEQTGLILFVRHNQKVRLTRAGKQLAEDWKKILDDFHRTANAAFALQRGEVNKLTIGDYDTTSMDAYLLPAVHQFEQQYPDTDVTIIRRHPEIIISDMSENRYDLSFAMAVTKDDTFHDDHLIVETIYELKPKLVISKKHELFAQESLSFQDLLSYDVILLNGPQYEGYNKKARTILAGCGFKNNRFYTEDPYDIAIELQRKNRFAVLDELFAPDGKENFRYIDVPDCGVNFGIQIVYSRDNTNPWLPKFIRLAKDVIASTIFIGSDAVADSNSARTVLLSAAASSPEESKYL